ncbi:hypothetical protein CR513_36422, partial [Mucuna pruriens]
MEDNIHVLLCKLEQIFSPSVFDSIEHLLFHLSCEAMNLVIHTLKSTTFLVLILFYICMTIVCNNYLGRGVGRRASATNNSLIFTIHISTSMSTILIVQRGTLPTIQEELEPTFISNLIHIIPSVVATPSALEDSLTHEYASLHSKHSNDQKSFLQAINKEFTPTHGPFIVILRIIRQKFDEIWLT